MVLPELVRLLSWTSANILPALDSSGKITNQGCLAMIRTILSANWWWHAFCWEFDSISTNANYYLSQSLTVAWLIFDNSSTSNLSLATGRDVLSRDFFYAWASPEYRDSLTSTGVRFRRLSKIRIRLEFLHGTFIRNKREIASFQTKYPMYNDTSVAGSYGCARRVIRLVHDNLQFGVSPPYHAPGHSHAAAYLISELLELPKIVIIILIMRKWCNFLNLQLT